MVPEAMRPYSKKYWRHKGIPWLGFSLAKLLLGHGATSLT
jgi:hypothetical protein